MQILISTKSILVNEQHESSSTMEWLGEGGRERLCERGRGFCKAGLGLCFVSGTHRNLDQRKKERNSRATHICEFDESYICIIFF